ncbi:hypothetical protein SCRES2_gp75 [Synechococcus phage S-CRES2]|nr:hypothetical protein SCRES2_gp75 [Synechococcus phage S-CRES2]
MMEHEDDLMGFEIQITDDEVRALYYAVTEALRNWPGAPKRPVEEQEHLNSLKMGLVQMLLEMQFER